MLEIHGNLSITQAFQEAHNTVATAVKGIAEIITVPGQVNVDFEDVATVMKACEVALMGMGVAEGEDRASRAVEAALNSPLLNNNDIKGAKKILVNLISGTKEVLMDELSEILKSVQTAAGNEADVIPGYCYDESLGDKLSVTMIATGFQLIQHTSPFQDKVVMPLEDVSDPEYSGEETANIQEDEQIDVGNQITFDFSTPDASVKDENNNSGNELKKSLTPTLVSGLINKPGEIRDRDLRYKLRNNIFFNEMEKEPAYKRRNVALEDMPPTIDSTNISRHTLSDEAEEEKF